MSRRNPQDGNNVRPRVRPRRVEEDRFAGILAAQKAERRRPKPPIGRKLGEPPMRRIKGS